MNKHFTKEMRKTISHFISSGMTLIEISKILECAPTSISKEVKRNRTETKSGKIDKEHQCKKLSRFPYICRECSKKGYNWFIVSSSSGQIRHHAQYMRNGLNC